MLTQQQIDQFHRDGVLIMRKVFQGGELADLRAAADRVVAEGVAGRGEHHIYREINGRRTYFRSEKMWDRDPIFRAVTVNPTLLENIGQCYGHPFLPINDSFVCKIPHGNVPVEWHQDPPYHTPATMETYEVPNFDTDIYLDASTVDNGCVWAIPGHHLVGHVDVGKYSEAELFERFGAIPLEMEPGDVLFHSISAPHGSVGNVTHTMRRIFYVHYMPREVWDNSYPGWAGSKRGFGPDGAGLVERMLADRTMLGLPGLDGSQVRWDGHAFEFVGKPTTPPRYWGELIRRMSARQIKDMQTLAGV